MSDATRKAAEEYADQFAGVSPTSRIIRVNAFLAGTHARRLHAARHVWQFYKCAGR